MKAWRVMVSAVVITVIAGCGGGKETPQRELTQRERDSVIGQSRLPGAQGVRGALDVTDSAAARRRLEDSIASN